MFQRPSGDWKLLPGKMMDVTVGDGNRIFGVNPAGDIHRWDAASAGWKQIPGKATSVSASYDGTLVAANDGGCYIWDHARGTWGAWDLPFRARSVAAGSGGKACAVAIGANDIWLRGC
jgi:hypothetical protein